MSERKEPGLSPEGLESLIVEPESRQSMHAQAGPPAQNSGGGSLLVTVILLLLVAAGGYLGYNLMQQQEQLAGLQSELNQAQARVESLESLLEVTSDSAEQSGQTLQQRLQDVDTRIKERFTHFDSEIAKLWTIAYQRNKPQLEQQAELLKKLQAQLADAETAVATLRKSSGKADEALTQLGGLKTEQASLKKALQARLAAAEKQLDTLEQGLKLESEGRLKVQKQLADQLSGLSGGGDEVAQLAQRIRQNEQAIKAIDGTRRQLNQDLLRIRQQLNNLQLRMEQG
jgi:chromosome segregation ATPase